MSLARHNIFLEINHSLLCKIVKKLQFSTKGPEALLAHSICNKNHIKCSFATSRVFFLCLQLIMHLELFDVFALMVACFASHLKIHILYLCGEVHVLWHLVSATFSSEGCVHSGFVQTSRMGSCPFCSLMVAAHVLSTLEKVSSKAVNDSTNLRVQTDTNRASEERKTQMQRC